MGIKQPKDTPPMEREINYLLYDLCVDLGFCINPITAEEISKRTHLTANTFANDVIEADGLNPEYEKQWVRKIENKFRERFGVEEIYENSFSKSGEDNCC